MASANRCRLGLAQAGLCVMTMLLLILTIRSMNTLPSVFALEMMLMPGEGDHLAEARVRCSFLFVEHIVQIGMLFGGTTVILAMLQDAASAALSRRVLGRFVSH